jgi:nucleoid-associated protein YgaU
MISRYDNTRIAVNNSKSYKQLFMNRNVKNINQFVTANIDPITMEQALELDIQTHVWKLGDRYYKLAHQFYGQAHLWWVIALFNQKPTESHLSTGDVLNIPTPIETVLEYLDI